MTFCDKLDSDEEFDLLRGWLSNSPHAHDAVPLEPYGYNVTVNKEARSQGSGESNQSKLVRQAQNEPGWFDREGLGAECAAGKAIAQALMNRVGTMYTEYVLSTFVPGTMGRLGQELLRCELERTEMGVPASPGTLTAGPTLMALQRGAMDRARALLRPLFDRAMAEYMTGSLVELQRALNEAIPERSTVGVQEVETLLARMVQTVGNVCAAAAASQAGSWAAAVDAALQDDVGPFRLQRFPRLFGRLRALCAAETLHLAENAVARAEAVAVAALSWDSDFVELERALVADPPHVVVKVQRKQVVIGRLAHVLAPSFVVPSEGRLEALLDAVVSENFAVGGQERETVAEARQRLHEREATEGRHLPRREHGADIQQRDGRGADRLGARRRRAAAAACSWWAGWRWTLWPRRRPARWRRWCLECRAPGWSLRLRAASAQCGRSCH